MDTGEDEVFIRPTIGPDRAVIWAAPHILAHNAFWAEAQLAVHFSLFTFNLTSALLMGLASDSGLQVQFRARILVFTTSYVLSLDMLLLFVCICHKTSEFHRPISCMMETPVIEIWIGMLMPEPHIMLLPTFRILSFRMINLLLHSR